MLSPRYLAGVSDDIVKLYSQLEIDILTDMARRMASVKGITSATEWQAGILAEIGGLRADINKILSKYDKETQELLSELFNEALAKAQRADLAVFDGANRELSETQRQILDATVAKTQSAGIVTGSKKVVESGIIKTFSGLQRLTMTIADTASGEFVQQMNSAYMQVASGAFSYQQAMRNSLVNLAQQGIKTVLYTDSGKQINYSIEAAVRMNVLTGINQTASQQTMINCEMLECDLVETTAHLGARPTHAAWQGQVFSLSGKHPDYPSFHDVCRPGTADGICGINCRHSYYPYFEGTERHYSEKQLEKMNESKVSYNGKQMSQYEGEQELRKIERGIRHEKRMAATLEAGGEDATVYKNRIYEGQKLARDFCEQTGIPRDYSREYIGTAGKQPMRVKPKPVDFTQSRFSALTI